MSIFGRLVTAMVTPFNDDLTVNYGEAANLARYLVEKGSDGIVVAGTTGESATLDKEEKANLFKVVKETVGDRAKVIAGTGSNNTAESVKLTREAEKAGVDGIMLVTPYYNKPPQKALVAHFTEIAASTSLPVMVYNVPGRTAANILPSTWAELAKVENIVAAKEASGSLDQVSEVINATPDGFCVYSGDDSLTLPLLAVGCCGVVSVASHVVGPAMKKMIKAYFEGQVGLARDIHLALFPVFKGLFVTTSPIPVKTILSMMGHKVGGFRLPLCAAGNDEIKFLEDLSSVIKKLEF